MSRPSADEKTVGRFSVAAATIIAEVSRQRSARELLDPVTYLELQAAVEEKLREQWWAGFFESLHDAIHLLCPVCREDGQVEMGHDRLPGTEASVYYHIYRVTTPDNHLTQQSRQTYRVSWPVQCPASSLIVRRSQALEACAQEHNGHLPVIDPQAGSSWPTVCPPLGGRPLIVPSPA